MRGGTRIQQGDPGDLFYIIKTVADWCTSRRRGTRLVNRCASHD
jgi:hypothetical protein